MPPAATPRPPTARRTLGIGLVVVAGLALTACGFALPEASTPPTTSTTTTTLPSLIDGRPNPVVTTTTEVKTEEEIQAEVREVDPEELPFADYPWCLPLSDFFAEATAFAEASYIASARAGLERAIAKLDILIEQLPSLELSGHAQTVRVQLTQTLGATPEDASVSRLVEEAIEVVSSNKEPVSKLRDAAFSACRDEDLGPDDPTEAFQAFLDQL